MFRDWDHIVVCPDCEREFDCYREAAFLVDGDEFLCLDCALQRGAVYDFPHEVWIRAPDLTGLE
jgi:hypothetical protein